MAFRNFKKQVSERGLIEGYRSGLEELVADQIAATGMEVRHEAVSFYYTVPERVASYKPDFVLSNGIVIETKGRFVTEDRKKHRLLREQYPDLDIRFVFSNPNTKIGKKSPTSYAMWCDRLGILYSKKLIPEEWLAEKVEPKRCAAILKLSIKGSK